MRDVVELLLQLFFPRATFSEVIHGARGAIVKEDIAGALQIAARHNPRGYDFLLADHLQDERALRRLVDYFTRTLGLDEAECALALLLRRPFPEQVESLVSSHPLYDKERRRAAICMEKAKRARHAGKEPEYQRLKGEHDMILTITRKRCMDEMMQTGRCPQCQGTGRRVRAGDECQKCHGSGRIVPDHTFMQRRFGKAHCFRIEHEVDIILAQASSLSSLMRKQIKEMISQ